MTLFPHLQLQVGYGRESISTIPPEYLEELTFKSSYGGISHVDFKLTDPSYTKIEKMLILSDTAKEPLFVRFGYLDSEGHVMSEWLRMKLMNFSPELTTHGMEITASSLMDVSDQVVELINKTYTGKISKVVKEVAADMGLDYEVEETDDDINSDLPASDGGPGPASWPTKLRSLLAFIKEDLVPIARSKSGSGVYKVFITGSSRSGGSTRKPVLHFHTSDYDQCSIRKKKVKKLTYLAGKQDQVLEFKPEYNSSTLGKIGVAGLTVRTYNSGNKTFTEKTKDINSINNKSSPDKNNRTAVTPLSDDPRSTSKSGGTVVLPEKFPGYADAVANNLWFALFDSSFKASLTLVGLPGYSDIESNDLIDITVLVPSPSQSGDVEYKTHWSSGTYVVTEAVHTITAGQYTISCQLQRSTSSIGEYASTVARYLQ